MAKKTTKKVPRKKPPVRPKKLPPQPPIRDYWIDPPTTGGYFGY